MKLYSKAVAGLLATTALAFGVAVQADTGPGDCGPGMMGGRMGGRMAGDPTARIEQHLTHFKSELKITPAQEPLWQAFADKVKSEAGQGIKAMRDQAQQPATAPERMNRRIEMMKARIPAMEAVAASFKSLYDALSPEQKAVADKHQFFAHHMGPGGPGGQRGPGGPGGMPRGPGRGIPPQQ